MQKNPILERMEQRVEKAKSFKSGELGLAATRIRYENQLRAYQKLLSPRGKGEYLIWTTGYSTQVILNCFQNVTDFHPSGYANLAGVWRFARRYCDIAEKAGFSRDTCSSIRAQIGVLLSGEVPKPDLLISNTMVCDGCFQPWPYVAERLGVPIFQLDVPAPYYDMEEAVLYVKRELEDMIACVEELTHQKLDYDLLEARVERSLRAAEISREINELRKAVPAPMRGRDANRVYGAGLGGGGGFRETAEGGAMSSDEVEGRAGCGAEGANMTDAEFDALLAIRDEVKGRVERGEGVVPVERHRILWCQTPPFYIDLTSYLEKEHGAVMAFNDPHKEIWWRKGEYDGMEPLEVIARQFLIEPWNGPGERRTRYLVQNAKDYKCDGAIIFKQWGCSPSAYLSRQLQDHFMTEVGIPSLVLDEDYIDATNFSEDETKANLDAFIQML